MSKALGLLLLTAAAFTIAAGAASAQTVIVKGASPGDRLELVVNGSQVAEGTIGGDGQGTLTGQLPLNEASKAEIDARVYVDGCEKLQRVHIVDRNQQPPPRAEGCERREIGGIFWIRQRSTVVIEVGSTIPTLLLRQGAYDPNAAFVKRESPRGLVLSAGGGWGSVDDVLPMACGDVGECDGRASGGAYSAGATFWLLRWAAVEGMYIKPRKASFEAEATNFRFNYFLNAEAFTVGGKLAGPFGPVRLYGHGGGAFHRATAATTQTNDPLEFTANGVTFTVAGGTQTIETRSEGWGWYAGGGLEGWVSPRFALFGEATFVKMKGDPTSGTDLPFDHMFTGVFAGLRLRVF
ncbi:MAG TPA: hypothetical protein VM364_09690 [Vicinamibacterales bacterium]|nr:hypothetical protein [Vicinamibacterales bacterium]